MPMKAMGDADEPRVIDRWNGGLGWIAHPAEEMERASHAITGDDGVFVIDPVDARGVDDLLADIGDVAGVVVLLDRHSRDAGTIANRHDVPVYVPAWMDGVAGDLDAPVERFRGTLSGTDFRVDRSVNLPFWTEAALYDGETLIVADALGTAGYFRTGEERLGVHPMLRLLPPRRALDGLEPERILVGHGEGVLSDAAPALRTALATARRRTPRVYAKALASILP